MRLINAVVVLITLIASAHADEPKATVQINTTPIENPPLPRPRPSLRDVTGDNPAVLVSAFRHQNGEESVSINSALTRVAQKQAEAMAILMRLTLTRTSAPILNSLRRMVPQVAWANGVCLRAMRRNAQTST